MGPLFTSIFATTSEMMSWATDRFDAVVPRRICWDRFLSFTLTNASSPKGAAAESLEQSADLNLQRALDLLGAGRYLSARR